MFGDTWHQDAIDGTQQNVSDPTPRREFAMTCDPVVDNVMSSGGRDALGVRDETWSYDGAA